MDSTSVAGSRRTVAARLACATLAFFLALVASSSVPRPAAAQPAAADSAAVLLSVARAFESRGEDEVARALFRHIVESFPGTPAARELADRVARIVRGGGETELAVWSTTHGLWLGVAVPWALNAGDSWHYGLGMILGGPAGYLGGRAYAGARPVSPGQARAIGWGGTWGTLQGLGWANALELGASDGDRDQARVAAMVGGGAAGILVGALAARREIRSGTATAANLGSLWGAWLGFAGSFLLEADEEARWASAMGVGNAGLVGGALVARRASLSRSRARLVSLGGLIGGFAGLGAAMIAGTGNDRVLVGLPAAGSVLGLATGVALTRDRDAGPRAEPAAEAAGAPPGGALLNWTNGNLALSLPLPSPAWKWTRPGGAGTPWAVPLFNARF